ncbi:M28 family peptidase [Echinicola vietnamensis]|uniref:Putative aminopeptidase n=1 Tax=Echinicola vietnamensis (strain DSM 17526 / LMG 23754 / KMM 6221) TaxID=926556 RepID=L0FWF7_ECHVK|nr:M28 family peptidase [Echinicola vietnamensis]AGA77378.1 putative aminopeptidase [Echinicola vietnamensis DSM 17526]
MPKIIVLMLFILSPLCVSGQRINRAQLMEDFQFLASDALEGRAPLTEGSKKAQKLIKSRFAALGLTSQYDDFTQLFSFGKGTKVENAANIVGFVPGTESDKIIVVTAHYDHLGKKDGKIYNGADDNASGTAALIAMATYFAENRPTHSMIFAALDAEEMGLQGAKALVRDFPFPLEQVILNINMDMISRSDKNEIYACGTHHYPQLKPILEEAAKGSKVTLKLGHDLPGSGHDDWTSASDHAPFHAKGIPFVYFGVEDHPDYHRDTDTFDKVNQDFYYHVVQLILNSVMDFDQEIN